jgi:hypothetical protein
MQSHDMAEKVRMMVDGEEIQGLVSFGELKLEKGQIEVPEFKVIRLIQSGITKIPAIDVTFKISRNSNTYKKIKDWFFKDEIHDITKVRCDASGTEFGRTLFPSAECVQYHEPPFQGEAPVYAQIQTRFLAWDIIPL